VLTKFATGIANIRQCLVALGINTTSRAWHLGARAVRIFIGTVATLMLILQHFRQ
jgi:hypothetical protein